MAVVMAMAAVMAVAHEASASMEMVEAALLAAVEMVQSSGGSRQTRLSDNGRAASEGSGDGASDTVSGRQGGEPGRCW